MRYTLLDAGKIVDTAERLSRRIDERFPGFGLSRVAAELVSVARETGRHADELARPSWLVRGLLFAIVAVGLVFAARIAHAIWPQVGEDRPLSVVQGAESAMNIAVLVGLGIITLTRFETRRRLTPALQSLHALRSLAHVIDMHQLTKDPAIGRTALPPTASSPRQELGSAELAGYLDFCSEMLSLIGKLAALYAQSQQNSDVIDTVNDIEVLTTNLARKIWQKIAIVEGRTERASSA